MTQESSELQAALQRVEAQLAIGQLPARYALALDSRNLEDLGNLFAADVDCGRWGTGREALKAYYASKHALNGFYRCVHLICGQTIDLIDADHAAGTVYCRAGHEDKDHWVEMAICYFDTYVRSQGRWCFKRREEKHWYATDWERRPGGPSFQQWPGKFDGPRYQAQLPQAWPSWQRYWAEAGDEARDKVTHWP